MLSNQEIKELGRVARMRLEEDEVAVLCHDLNALLEMTAVLESLPQDGVPMENFAALKDLREDVIVQALSLIGAGRDFSVPPVMEKT